MNHDNKVNCPKCNHEINVNELIYSQIESELNTKHQQKIADDEKALQIESLKLQQEQSAFKLEKKQQQNTINEAVSQQVTQAEKTLRTDLTIEIKNEQSEALHLLNTELQSKTNELKELNLVKAQLAQKQREKDELKGSLAAENEIKLNEQMSAFKIQEGNKSQLQILEHQKTNEQLQEQLRIALRKGEQGSMQLQGEVQEIAIETWLQENFMLDTIFEIVKGARGGDCLQIVNTPYQQNCGTIYYESKRTKSFHPSWIEKFKDDIREKNADIGVLVTESMPIDMDRMGIRDGIWICSFEEFKGLSGVLRESVIQIFTASMNQDNKGEKMTMLYNYLISNEFKLQIEAIVEGFTQMETDLNKEKKSIAMTWKKREKQLQKVLLNTCNMHGAIKGIAGNAIEPIPLLELSALEDSSEEKDTTDESNPIEDN